MTDTANFETHPVRGRFNASFFTALDGYINWLTGEQRRPGLPDGRESHGPARQAGH
jgi:hypothetical protein